MNEYVDTFYLVFYHMIAVLLLFLSIVLYGIATALFYSGYHIESWAVVIGSSALLYIGLKILLKERYLLTLMKLDPIAFEEMTEMV